MGILVDVRYKLPMDYRSRSFKEVYPIHLVRYILAGLFFLILSIQVIFPKLSIPMIRLLVSAVSMVDFIAHEMGHVIFSFMGEFIGVLGGTLGQLFLPTVCLLLTVRRRQWFACGIFMFWIGQSLNQISTYIMDARTQQLKLFSPGLLLGGGNPIHDWHYLLDKTGLLWADNAMGWMVNLAGFSFLIGAILLMFYRAASTSSKIN